MSARGRADREAACVTLLSQTISLYTVLLDTCDWCQLHAQFPASPSTENRHKGTEWISYARDASEYLKFHGCIISPMALTEGLLSSGITKPTPFSCHSPLDTRFNSHDKTTRTVRL